MNQNDFQDLFSKISNQKAKYYDDEINTPILKIAKAVVPYLDLKSQQQFGIIIKIIEIQRLSDLYDSNRQEDLEKNNNKDNKKNNFDSMIINIIKAYYQDAKPKKTSQKNSIDIKNLELDKNKNKNNKNKNINILEDNIFKDLSDNDKNFLKKFLRDISDKSKSPLEIFNIMIEYNKKLPKSFGEKQKNAMINALIQKLSPDKQNQFFDIYKTFFSNK